jgi:hypothetical protein
MFLRADSTIIQLHANVQEYASAVNSAIAVAHGGISPHPLSGGALYSLTADLFGMHRAVLSVCEDGWAFTAVVLLRSMMDLLLSVVVIAESEPEAEYRGFKYTHFFMKAQMNNPDLSSEARADLRAQIEDGIGKLPLAQKERAKHFMFKERLLGYWFCPEYKRPSDVLDRLSRPDIRFNYDLYSSGAHGGFLGLRVLKDKPDQVHPNPRPDARSQHLALAGSSRILLEGMHIWDAFELGGAKRHGYDQLLARLGSLRPN